MADNSETITDICRKLRSIDSNDRCGVKEKFDILCGGCSTCTAYTAHALADRIEKAYLNGLKLAREEERKIGHIDIFMEDEDGILGHCSCSECNKNVELFDNYCSHCGAHLAYAHLAFKKRHESEPGKGGS